jgi:hypothetical protein
MRYRTARLTLALLLCLLGAGSTPVAANTDPPVAQQAATPEPQDCRPLSAEELQVGTIVAGIETCETTVSLTTETMPHAAVQVAADQVGIYSGPGAQYPRLAVLPQETTMQLTGQTRNGWVSVQLLDIPLIGWAFAPYLSVSAWGSGSSGGDLVSQPLPPTPPISEGAPVSGTLPLLPTPEPGLPGAEAALILQPRPTASMTLVVQVCTGQVAGATTACLPQFGIDRVPVQVVTEAGDLLAAGITDAQGRWTVQVPRQGGAVQVVAPLLDMAQTVDLARTTETVLVVPLSIPEIAIPPTLG